MEPQSEQNFPVPSVPFNLGNSTLKHKTKVNVESALSRVMLMTQIISADISPCALRNTWKTLAKMLMHLSKMPEITSHITIIHSKCKLCYNDDPQFPTAVTKANVTPIHFCTNNVNADVLCQYNTNVNHDLHIHQMSISGSPAE